MQKFPHKFDEERICTKLHYYYRKYGANGTKSERQEENESIFPFCIRNEWKDCAFVPFCDVWTINQRSRHSLIRIRSICVIHTHTHTYIQLYDRLPSHARTHTYICSCVLYSTSNVKRKLNTHKCWHILKLNKHNYNQAEWVCVSWFECVLLLLNYYRSAHLCYKHTHTHKSEEKCSAQLWMYSR